MSAENVAIDNYACPHCRAVFRTAFQRCPLDGHLLQPLVGDPLAGSSFADRYIIEECVGEGGMGRVYRARHQRMSRLFAIKVLFGDHAADKKMQARLAREAEAASRLSHPNVISVLDFGDTDAGLLYLVMDYVAGPTLAALIEKQAPFHHTRILKLVRDMARGLSHAHQCGLIHRDFKADNVIIGSESGEEIAKIVDFGIAMLNEPNKSRKLTTEGMVLGTPAVMAPEQAVGEAVDQRTDLFSLGIVLYEMLCGHLPFDGSPMEIARQNLSSAVPRIVDRVPGLHVDPDLEALAVKLMAKRPDDRPQSAKEVLRALSRIEGENSLQFQRTEGSFLESAGLDPSTPPPQAPVARSPADARPPQTLASTEGGSTDYIPDLNLTEMTARDRRKRATMAWLIAAAGVVVLGVFVGIIAVTGKGAVDDGDSASAENDSPPEAPATGPTPSAISGDAAPVATRPDGGVEELPAPVVESAAETKRREIAARKKERRERREKARREKELRKAGIRTENPTVALPGPGGERQEAERQLEAERQRQLEAERQRQLEAAAREAATAASRIVTVKQFNARFKRVGTKLNKLARLDPSAASGLKKSYSKIQGQLTSSLTNEVLRKRLYRQLNTIGNTAAGLLREAKE